LLFFLYVSYIITYETKLDLRSEVHFNKKHSTKTNTKNVLQSKGLYHIRYKKPPKLLQKAPI
jgi:hypothetical protein